MTIPIYNATDVWNDSSTVFTAIKMNVTNTASAAASKYIDLQISGTSKLALAPGSAYGGLGGGVISTIYDPDSGGLAIGNTNSTVVFGATTSGNSHAILSSVDFRVRSGTSIGWSSNSGDVTFTNADTMFLRDAAGIVAQRNSTNANSFRVYNTFTDASNYERAVFGWTDTSNTLTIGTQAAGTGTLRAVKLIGSDVTVQGNTATPAGGSTSARLLFGTTAGFGIYYGSGAPTVSAAAGSLYIRTDNAGANLRLYSNTTGSTTWAAITSA